jgi:hypothetical protein
MASSLTQLACGEPPVASDLAEILAHLGSTLDVFIEQARKLSEQDDVTHTFIGPFIGRSLLELFFTSIIARIDPFRVLVLRKMQRQPDYNLGVRRASSIQWQGDILAARAPTQPIWADHKLEDISRAILSDYHGHVHWESALTRLVDTIDAGYNSPWFAELQAVDPANFPAQARAEATRLYSSLSKGMHHEFVIPPENLYDRTTVSTLITDGLRLCGKVGLLSHMIPHCPCSRPLEYVLPHFDNLQALEVS